MDFSLWDLSGVFRLHEAACLIAGVQPLSKRVPDREELPPEAIPIYVKLGSAYVLNWVAHNRDLPEDPKHPIESMLRADSLDGSGIPTLHPNEPLKRLTGEFVSREELHRWIAAMGINSAYSFAPIAKPDTAPALNKPTPTTEMAGGKTWTPEKKDAARAMLNKLRGQGIRDFSARTAAEYDVSTSRLRDVLNDRPKRAPSKKAKTVWDV